MEEGNFRRNITVVGLGLIGASYAMALKRLKIGALFGIDADKVVLDKAVSCGVIDGGAIKAKEMLGKSDIVIIALYPQDTIGFINDNAGHFRPGTIITDTCGIKKPIIEAVKERLQENVEFVGGHPMAGNEFQGFDAATGGLFIDTNYIITPHDGNSEEGIRTVECLALAVGCKCVTRISAETHDRMISFTSQLPHIIAVSLSNLLTCEPGMNAFTGRSFRDATRVAALNKELWTQIFRMNKTNLIMRIEDMEGMLHKLKDAILAQDESGLRNLLNTAIKGKREADL